MSDLFIPKEQLSAYERWELGSLVDEAEPLEPAIDEEAAERERAEAEARAAAEAAAEAAAAERERLVAEARDAGYAAGLTEGRAQAKSELERLQQVAAQAESLIGEAGERFAGEVLELALDLARQMIRTELKVRREALLPVVREALESLPHASVGAQLALNPADVELVRAHIGDEREGGGSLRLLEDHRIEPGGCRIVSPSGEVDATLVTRWKRLIAALGVEHDWLQKLVNADPHTQLQRYLQDCRSFVSAVAPFETQGRLTRIAGLVMEAVGLKLPLGSTCIITQDGGHTVEAEVVGFAGDRLFLMPATDPYGLTPGAAVKPLEIRSLPPAYGVARHPWRRMGDRTKLMPVGPELLGRVVDCAGRPLDNLGPLHPGDRIPLHSRPANPIEREQITETLDVGVRAINALITVGRGQRMGLFAGSGVGKSVLLGMMARYTSADVIVVGLIGERGREVKEFIEEILGAAGRRRAVVVAAPADTPPLSRLQGAAYATSIAEYFRDQGQHVLLIMDSLTRYAMAQREIALAIGEPPATKGYPPSVFAKLPQLVERAGNGAAGGGSITAFYTVLTEGDDLQDPIADSARAILDGHIVLSRSLADQAHYPAIDIEASVSRVMHALTPDASMQAVREFKSLYSRYQRNRDLVNVGAYVAGSDPVLDRALMLYPRMEAFLQQGMQEQAPFKQSVSALNALFPSTTPDKSKDE